MPYRILEADSAERLQEQVNLYIYKGWRPIGGVSVVNSHATSSWWYYQALILHGPEGKPDPDDDLA
jgi:hypothetical protein